MSEWRKVTIGDTSLEGTDQADYEYQFGAEIDGVFIPAVTKSGGYVDHLVALGKQDTATSGTTSDTPAEQTPPANPDQPTPDTPQA